MKSCPAGNPAQGITRPQSSIKPCASLATLRTRLIEHIAKMKTIEPVYSEFAHGRYVARLPWLDLPEFDALKGQQ